MKIGVFGTSHNINAEIKTKAAEIGKIIADNNHIVVTGGCDGNPRTAALSALNNNGKAIAYAVGLDIDDH